MKITTKVSGDIPIMVIGCNYNSRKVVRFISTEGAVNNEPFNTHLSRFPVTYSNFSILPVIVIA